MQRTLLIMMAFFSQACMAGEVGKIKVYNDTGMRYLLMGRGIRGEEYKSLHPGMTAMLTCCPAFEILEHETVPRSIGWVDGVTCEETLNLNLSVLLISLGLDKA